MLAAIVFTLAATAAPINTVLPCGKVGTVGGLGAGVDLTRYTIDTSKFPNAVCNDGTPGVFYYAPATRDEDRNKWIIFLQGGGACNDGQSCAERWCHVNTNYGMDKMTTSLTKPLIRGNGFLDPRPENHFGTWNRVLIFYCSSDAWAGTNTTSFQATGGATTVEYQIHFRGSQIIDAALDTLRNATPSLRHRAVRHSIETATSAWPDLDNATHVIFAGSSAGGIGAKSNADRVGAKLKSTNPNLVDYRLIIDASTTPQSELRDFTKSTYCSADPTRGCSYTAFTSEQYAYFKATFGARRDESCLAWHAAHQPGTEWKCEDTMHVNYHHITTPFFIHQDLQDPQVGGEYVDANFGDISDYATNLEAELRALPVPEEPRGATPGMHIPQCTDHESFTNDPAVYDVKVNGLSYYDTVWNWWTGAQPQQEIRHFTGTPGKAPGCP